MVGMTHVPGHVALLERGLREVFGARLQSLLVYGLAAEPASHHDHDGHHAAPRLTRTMALVETLHAADLKKCAERVAAWHELGLATPILLASSEFRHSLDAFPLEFDAIRADHACVAGKNPFDGVAVDPSDIRRACEVQARSHLLHLREGFVETQGSADALAVLIVKSAAPFAALLSSIARLEGLSAPDSTAVGHHVERHVQLPAGVAGDIAKLAHVQEISASEAARLFPAYLDATERLAAFVDQWRT